MNVKGDTLGEFLVDAAVEQQRDNPVTLELLERPAVTDQPRTRQRRASVRAAPASGRPPSARTPSRRRR